MARQDGELGEINIIPLVDVMLVLLTIVLVTASFVVSGRIPVNLAQAGAAEAATQAPLVVTMTQDRRLYLNDRPMPDIEEALAAYQIRTPVLVRADGELPLTEFVGLIDKIKLAGFTNVNLEVKRP